MGVWKAAVVGCYLHRSTIAPSYQTKPTCEVGSVAASAESRKSAKYCNMDPSHFFPPVVVEASGTIGQEALAFMKELGCKARRATAEKRSFPYLTQWIATANQRGNSACTMGSLGGAVTPTQMTCSFAGQNYIPVRFVSLFGFISDKLKCKKSFVFMVHLTCSYH